MQQMPARLQAAATAASRSQPSRMQRMRAAVAGLLASVGRTFGGIFFVPQPWAGGVLALALVSQPEHLAFAAVGLVPGGVAHRVLGFGDAPGSGGGVRANAMLAAIVTGWLTSATGLGFELRLLLAAAASVPAALLAAALMHFLSRSALPAVLVGYCIAAAMLFATCPPCTISAAQTLPVWPTLADAPGWAQAFLRSLAALMYGQDWASGAFVALGVFISSRVLFACGVAGWAGGALAAVGFEQLHLAFYWLPLSYNFFIAGSALGAALFVPGRASLPVAALAGALSAFFALALQYSLQWSSASYLPLSSAMAIWVGAGALSRVLDRADPAADASPEWRWWELAFWRARFGRPAPLLAVPVAGEVAVSQGFDGPVSHTGALRHALDFERPRAAGGPLGAIFGAEVYAPAAGTVERVCAHLPDNPVGVCDYAQPWGNHVVIRLDEDCGWAVLAHLQQASVAVTAGMRVEVGSYLGRVGNSGRSGFAHLHMQVQSAPAPGAATQPFRLANYLRVAPVSGRTHPWVASGVPAAGEVLAGAAPNAAVYQALAGIAPGSGVWTVESTGQVPRAFRPRRGAASQRVQVGIDGSGRHAFTTDDGATLIARLDPDAWRIESQEGASPLLRLLAWGASSVPYAARAGVSWSDLPPIVPQGSFRRPLVLALAPYLRRPFAQVACQCTADPVPPAGVLEVTSQLQNASARLPHKVAVSFAPLKGVVRVRADFARGHLVFSLLSFDPGGSRTPARR